MFAYEPACGHFQTLTKLTETDISFDPPVYEQRYCAAIQVLEDPRWTGQIKKVVEFGCSEMRFFHLLRRIETIEQILLVDIDEDVLKRNSTSINPLISDYIRKRLGPLHVDILQGNVADPSQELLNTDAVVALELIEHVYDDVLAKIPGNVFGFMRPKVAVFSTPNADFNAIFKRLNSLLPNGFRHDDHKFEWTREEFKSWCLGIVEKYPNYKFSLTGVGNPPEGSEDLGYVSQIAIFIRQDLLGMELLDCPASDAEPSSLYRVLHSVDFPFSVDTRTEKEKVWPEVQFELNRFKRMVKNNEDEVDSYPDGFRMPLSDLIDRIRHTAATKETLLEVLSENSIKIEDDFVIIESSDNSSDEHYSQSSDDNPTQEADPNANEDEDEEFWDNKIF